MAARMAVALCGGSLEQEEKIGRMAETIGIAFQIQDDILDIVSSGKERERFGKSFGNDIKEGKRTLMVIYTLRNAPKEEGRRLLDILNMHTTDRLLIEEAINILKRNKAIDYAKQKARELMLDSWKEADRLMPDSDAKKTLERFVRFLIERDF